MFTAATKHEFAMADAACTLAFDGVGGVGYEPLFPLLTRIYLHVVGVVADFDEAFPN